MAAVKDIGSNPAGPPAPVQAVVPPAKPVPVADAAGGNSLPPGGSTTPDARQAAVPNLEVAVQNLNRFLKESDRSLEFKYDKSAGRTIITIVNPSTGEVIRQIPPEEVLAAADRLRGSGSLLDARA
jgi:flagellar protein FlaG